MPGPPVQGQVCEYRPRDWEEWPIKDPNVSSDEWTSFGGDAHAYVGRNVQPGRNRFYQKDMHKGWWCCLCRCFFEANGTVHQHDDSDKHKHIETQIADPNRVRENVDYIMKTIVLNNMEENALQS
jgi:hypothetical protein